MHIDHLDLCVGGQIITRLDEVIQLSAYAEDTSEHKGENKNDFLHSQYDWWSYSPHDRL